MIAFARATITHDNGSFSNIIASRITEKRIRKISVTAADKYIDCNLLRKRDRESRRGQTCDRLHPAHEGPAPGRHNRGHGAGGRG